MTWTLADLDRVIEQAKLNHRSRVYIEALEQRRAALLAREEKPLAPSSERAGEAVKAVNNFLEAAMTLLELAPAVGDDAADVREMMGSLASWFPPEAEEDEGMNS